MFKVPLHITIEFVDDQYSAFPRGYRTKLINQLTGIGDTPGEAFADLCTKLQAFYAKHFQLGVRHHSSWDALKQDLDEMPQIDDDAFAMFDLDHLERHTAVVYRMPPVVSGLAGIIVFSVVALLCWRLALFFL